MEDATPKADTFPAPAAARTVRATVCFANLVGFTALCDAIGPERAYGAVTGCLRLLDGIARRHGGAVDKYLGDSLMLVFGYPVPLARPATAAVQAALEMRQQVRDYDRELDLPVRLRFQAGIATGTMVAGAVGTRMVREFHVLGDVVNVAARLRAKAPLDAVRVDETTAREAGDPFVWSAVEPLALKGKSRTVSACDALRMRSPRARRSLGEGSDVRTPLIAREHELDRLRHAAERLRNGEGGVLWLTGAEGIGKSRLLAELGADPAILALDCVTVQPAPAEAAPAGSAATDLCALLSTDAVAPALPELTAALRNALAAQRRPLLIAIEDADRIDAASLEVFAALLDLAEAQPLLFLISSRPSLGPALARLRECALALGARCDEIVLEPLPAEPAGRLVDSLLGDTELTATARALLLERAAGNPGRLRLGAHFAPALAAEGDHAAERDERAVEAERRRATILFADITGFTAMTERLGAARAYPIVAGCLARLDEVARKYGGHVEKHMGDCVMATFGLPEAIEDAPRAAINAAIEMRARVRDYNREQALESPLDVHAGIHTGLGIAGDVSGPLLREFAVLGEPVDLASRLTDLAAAGQIFVGPDTQRLTREVFAFQPLPAIEIAGRAAPLAPFEVLSDRVHLHRERVGRGRQVSAPLIGRDRELTLLRERLGALESGRGSIVSLIAEAGIGKSRLVAELAASPEAAGVTWLEGRSLSNGRTLRFHPFADLLRSWAGIGDEDDDASACRRLESTVAGLLGDEADGETPLLALLLGLPLEPAEQARLARIPHDTLETLLRRAVARVLLQTAGSRPLVLVMDDLHWADDSSRELLVSLLPSAAAHPILFLLLTRPGGPTPGHGLEAPSTVEAIQLRLEALSRSATRDLLAQLFAADALPHETRAQIEAKAGGNPFFVEEVVRSLLDQGAVENRAGRFHATARIGDVAIPDTLHEVVAARVDRLPLRRRTPLQTASVIGRSFQESVLATVLGAPEALEHDLSELVADEFLVPWDQTHGREWAFQHALLHEVTYDGLLETRRAALHRQVARAAETCLSSDAPGWAGMLAWHYSKGGEDDRAEEYLFSAGEEAARVAASSEALHFFQEASKLFHLRHGDGGDPRKAARLARQLALALFHRGRLAEADEHFERALSHLGVTIRRHPTHRALGFARDMISVLGRLYRGTRRSAGRPATDRDRERIAVLWERAQAQITVSPTRFLFDSMAGLAQLGRLDPTTVPGAGGMYAGAVGIFAYGGVSFAIGRRFLAHARPLVDDRDVPERLVVRTMNLLQTVLEGDWSDEHRIEETLLEEGLRFGLLWEVTNALNLEGLKQIYRGNWDAGAVCIERLGKLAEQYQHTLAASAQHFLQAILHMERRQLGEALAAFDRYLDEHPEPAFRVSALGHRAVVQWLSGDLEGARASIERGERRLGEVRRPLPYHASNFFRARQLLDVVALEEPGAASSRAVRRQAARSRRVALRGASRVAWRVPEVLRTAGTEAWLTGRRRRARTLWAKSIERAERMGMRAEQARTEAEIGRRLLAAGEGTNAAAPLRAAREGFAALGLDEEQRALEAICSE